MLPDRSRWTRIALIVLTAPLWLTALAIVMLAWFAGLALVYVMVWTWWMGSARRRTLFIYSDSPNWRDYVEAEILPNLPPNTVVLNWSNRSAWPLFSLPAILFGCFAGANEFNPLGLVFERLRLVERYRFWQPFRDAKHGRPDALRALTTRFLQHAGR